MPIPGGAENHLPPPPTHLERQGIVIPQREKQTRNNLKITFSKGTENPILKKTAGRVPGTFAHRSDLRLRTAMHCIKVAFLGADFKD